MTIGSFVGLFTVLGIAARNGILMISHCQHLEAVEGMKFGPELVIRAARERLAPILMTTLATGLALAPLVIMGDVPGTRSSIRWRSSSWVGSRRRRFLTCSSSRPCT